MSEKKLTAREQRLRDSIEKELGERLQREEAQFREKSRNNRVKINNKIQKKRKTRETMQLAFVFIVMAFFVMFMIKNINI